MSDYPMLISNKLHSFRNFGRQNYQVILYRPNKLFRICPDYPFFDIFVICIIEMKDYG